MTPPEKLIGPSKHPHSSDALMKEARRLLRAAGYTYKHAGSAVDIPTLVRGWTGRHDVIDYFFADRLIKQITALVILQKNHVTGSGS